MLKKIKIAIVAHPFGDWGGPEIMVQNLVDELLKKNIDVTLFAPGDWKTKAKHIATLKQSLWKMEDFKKQTKIVRQNLIIYSQIKVLDYQDKFDLIHINSQKHAYFIGKMLRKPCVLTLHGEIDKPELQQIKEAKIYTVSLSESQNKKIETFATIGNGVPMSKIKCELGQGDYLMTVARLTPQKGVDKAIQIAKQAGEKLLIFGRITNNYKEYFEKKIKPFLDGKNIIYKKEVSHKKIYDYYRNAKALLFTITEPEPFGLVMAEALACGTPIIGSKIGQMPELLGRNNQISFLSNETKELVGAVKNIDKNFDRQKCRDFAEKNFSSARMADEYVKVYQRILKK